MKCPYCGSNEIIWDYKTGDLICSTCASVIDKVYYNDLYEISDDIVITPKYAYYDFFKKLKRLDEYKNKIRKNNKRKIRMMVMYNGSSIRESSLSAMKIIENNERLLILYDIMDTLPQFRSKNSNYKLAVGLYLLDKKEFCKLRRNLNINDKYMKKLLSKLKVKDRLKIQSLLKRKIDSNLVNEQTKRY